MNHYMSEMPDHPVIDGRRLESVSGGDVELEKEFFETYLDETIGLVQKFKQCLQDGDELETCRAAHSIKGASANLGVSQLSELARRAEEVIRTESLPAAFPFGPLLESSLMNLREELKKRYGMG